MVNETQSLIPDRKHLREIILSELGRQSPLGSYALLNKIVFAYNQNREVKGLMLKDYDDALEGLVKENVITYEPRRRTYALV